MLKLMWTAVKNWEAILAIAIIQLLLIGMIRFYEWLY